MSEAKKKKKKKKGFAVPEEHTKFVFHDLCDVIVTFLKIPSNIEQCTFVARQENYADQFWHGAVYRESPYFTFDCVTTSSGSRIHLGEVIGWEEPGGEFNIARVVSFAEVGARGQGKIAMGLVEFVPVSTIKTTAAYVLDPSGTISLDISLSLYIYIYMYIRIYAYMYIGYIYIYIYI